MSGELIHLNAHKLATWQRGRRLYAIEQTQRYLPWHPTALFSTCMRHAIFHMSSGMPREEATQRAVSLFVAKCKSPGLDTRYGTNTYTLAMDFCATIRTILAYLERITLTTLTEIAPVNIPHTYIPDLNISWSFLSHVDEAGILHRWVFVDRIDEDRIFKELHKWETIADIIVYGSPMMLHLVAIGQTISGRRYSPWCRAYKNPVIAGQIRFQKRKGHLTDNWTPIYFADNPKNDPDHWLDQMLEDGAHEGLMFHKTVGEPEPSHVEHFYRDMRYEAKQMLSMDVSKPLDLPMCRVSCDVPFACPHQVVCYSLTATFENSGLYEAIENRSPEPRTNPPSSVLRP
jgi:hypothetical protein